MGFLSDYPIMKPADRHSRLPSLTFIEVLLSKKIEIIFPNKYVLYRDIIE